MSKERYNQIIDEAYENYLKSFTPKDCLPNIDVQPSYYEPMTKEWFILSLRELSDRGEEFSKKWGLKIEEQKLTEERRYNIWFNNNYETGMERFFNLEQLPDYDNPYYQPTPTKEITISYNGEKISFYE